MGTRCHAELPHDPVAAGTIANANANANAEARLWLLRSTLLLLHAAAPDETALQGVLARHPALQDTLAAVAGLGLADLTLDEALQQLDARLDIRFDVRPDPGPDSRREPRPETQLNAAPRPTTPLQRLRARLGLDADGLSCFVLGALADADPRLAALVDEVHGLGGRPTRATLQRLFGGAEAAAVQALRAAGCLVQTQRALAAPPELWDLACGLPPLSTVWRYTPTAELKPLQALILPSALQARLQAGFHEPGPACWLLRGVPGSGRGALAAALAQAHGLGLLELRPSQRLAQAAHSETGDAAALTGAAATLLGALPLLSFDPAPGESLSWPVPDVAPDLVAVRLPRHGGLAVPGRPVRRVELETPALEDRHRHWQAALGRHAPAALADLRLPSGTLHRVAANLATTLAAAGPITPAEALMRAALDEVEALGRHALDGVARRVPPAHPGEALALPEAAREEFAALIARCRHRDRIAAALPGTPPGVRALFKGPSGTGKTLAARQLAAALQRPLYRVDLAATVSKYIGETERNLERVFEAAEALDIVLLLDEGDALLAGRTGVSNATDRYANLETNYLLQRLEHFSGVLVVTTNAAERIDTAFARRMDVSIEFPLPDAHTRLDLWLAHLGAAATPSGGEAGHTVPDDWLDRVALRCTLAGGQIRNTVLHATLLALDSGRPLGAPELQRALDREYRKAGQQCPTLDNGG